MNDENALMGSGRAFRVAVDAVPHVGHTRSDGEERITT
jgi:hypothetical protein